MSIPVELRVDELTVEEHRAVKAFANGAAQPHQQAMVLAVILKISRAHDLLYVPGNPDAGIFLNGRAFVGMQILKAIKTPIRE